MDQLETLPKSSTKMTPQEKNVMTTYFNDTAPDSSTEADGGDSDAPGINWKCLAYLIGLFVLLANPWIDGILTKIPYCEDNAFILLGVKILLFAVGSFIITRYVAPTS